MRVRNQRERQQTGEITQEQARQLLGWAQISKKLLTETRIAFDPSGDLVPDYVLSGLETAIAEIQGEA